MPIGEDEDLTFDAREIIINMEDPLPQPEQIRRRNAFMRFLKLQPDVFAWQILPFLETRDSLEIYITCKKTKSMCTYGNPDSVDLYKHFCRSERYEDFLTEDPNIQEVLARTIQTYKVLPATLRVLDRFEVLCHMWFVRFKPMNGPVIYNNTYERIR